LYFIFLISRQYDLVDAKRLATKPSPKSFLKLTIEAGFITFWQLYGKRWKTWHFIANRPTSKWIV